MFKNDKIWAYLILRLTMGVNMLAHGLVRTPKVGSFSGWMVQLFEDTFIPSLMVNALGHSLPFVELGVGALLIVGLFTRKAILAGSLLMVILVFGSCLVEKWDWAVFQMIYALFFFTLAYLIEFNTLSIDKKIGFRKIK